MRFINSDFLTWLILPFYSWPSASSEMVYDYDIICCFSGRSTRNSWFIINLLRLHFGFCQFIVTLFDYTKRRYLYPTMIWSYEKVDPIVINPTADRSCKMYFRTYETLSYLSPFYGAKWTMTGFSIFLPNERSPFFNDGQF